MPSIVTPIFPFNTSGPFNPTSNASLVGGLTRNPVGFTYQEVVRAVYGIKRYRLHVAASWVQSALSDSYDVTTYFPHGSISASATPPIGFTSETGLVVYGAPGGAAAFQWSLAPWLIISFFLITAGATPKNYQYSGDGLYYPNFIGNRSAAVPNRLGMSAGTHVAGQAQYDSFSGNFLGKTIACETYSSAAYTLNSALFEVIASPDGGGYWPYDPGDGPVWHTDTGAQLRDPFAL